MRTLWLGCGTVRDRFAMALLFLLVFGRGVEGFTGAGLPALAAFADRKPSFSAERYGGG